MMTSTIGCEFIDTPLHLNNDLPIDPEYVIPGNDVSSVHENMIMNWCKKNCIKLERLRINNNIISM